MADVDLIFWIKESHPQKVLPILEVFQKVLQNLVESPEDPKLRKLRLENPVIRDHISGIPESEALLLTAGFSKDQEFYVFEGSDMEGPLNLLRIIEETLVVLKEEASQNNPGTQTRSKKEIDLEALRREKREAYECQRQNRPRSPTPPPAPPPTSMSGWTNRFKRWLGSSGSGGSGRPDNRGGRGPGRPPLIRGLDSVRYQGSMPGRGG